MSTHRSHWKYSCLLLICASIFTQSTGSAVHQQPSSPSSTQPAPESPKSPKTVQAPKHKHSRVDAFLIRGTVFTDKALAFPGAEIRIRRTGEKKFRWQDLTNSRGNFAIRVPQDASYEVFTRAKGYQQQSKTIEAKPGLTEQSVVFQMERLGGKK